MPSSATTAVPSSLVTNASSRESMNRTVATSFVDWIRSAWTSSRIDAPSPRDSMNTGSGSGSVADDLANQRTMLSYTALARTSGEAGEPDEQAASADTSAATTSLRPRTATSTAEQYHRASRASRPHS